MQNLLKKAYELLKKDERLVSNEGELLKNKIQELSYKLDEKLVDLLYSDETIRAKFFKKINEVWLFDSNRFVKFINNKEFLPDSYTSFKNKIGLVDSKEDFIADKNDVVLNRPYKDCILAGGQDTEDAKRDEIFYNEVLASDEIDRLLDPKVFTNFKKYDKDGESEFTEWTKDENGDIKDNMIIKGNNLLVLHSLKKKFAGKVKLIYIDPPYNTGNDGFNYNDRFNHSTWLTFMKNRLEVAKELLRDDGVIFVQADDNEQAYLKVIMDEIFGRDNFIANLIWEKKSGRQNDAKFYSSNHEFILNYGKSRENFRPNLLKRTDDMLLGYKNPDNDPRGVRTSITLQAKSGGENNVFEIEFPNGIKWSPPKGTYARFSKNKLLELYDDNRLYFGDKNQNKPRLKKFLSDVKDGVISNTILFTEDASNTQKAKAELQQLFGENVFDTPKPEKLIQYLINLATVQGDIILDYHLGSGTTCAVAHKMGRQYLGIEQMDYIKEIALERMKKVIAGEQGGISQSEDWQGGGSLIYFETMDNNNIFLKNIANANTKESLIEIYCTIRNTGFVNYRLDIDNLEKDVETLDFQNLKNLLVEIIDYNTLYMNFSEIKDKCNNVESNILYINNEFYL